jgi:hypothetical protein
MAELSIVAAMINDGEVVSVGALSTDNDYSEWLESAKKEYDEVLLVTHAGIGWKVTPDGLRPDKPFDSWVWNDKDGWYESPVPYPSDGSFYRWDEDVLNWVAVN